jgi:NAD-dependent SIR2 family protein deacetylase
MTAFDSLQNFVDRHRRLFVVTGAGCDTNSGIPDYRDADGNWKHQQPVTYQAFMADEATRQCYWARRLIGWRRFGRALPNDAHRALARLAATGRSEVALTQNVDRLHQAAGSERRSTIAKGKPAYVLAEEAIAQWFKKHKREIRSAMVA